VKKHVCQHCYSIFKAYGKPKFCSRDCRWAEAGTVDHKCPTCKKPFKVIRSRLLKSKNVYCSASCRSQQTVGKGAASPVWKGGTKATQARTLRRIHGNDCMRCCWNEAQTDVHHIVPKSVSQNHELTNLIILCPNCHRLADTGALTQDTLKTLRAQAELKVTSA